MPNLTLTVNGAKYGGWKSIVVTRGIDAICGGFDLAVSDRYPSSFPSSVIREGDECAVHIDAAQIIKGYVDSRRISYDATTHTFGVTGRDKAADLVDSSAIIDKKWQFKNQSVLAIVKAIAGAYGIAVALAPGVVIDTQPKQFSINPGESAFEAIDRICRIAAVLPVSDGNGGIFLTRGQAVARAATELVEGVNILSADASYDLSDRFYKYIVAGQHSGSDDLNGAEASAVEGIAYDRAVRPTRSLMVRAEGIVTRATAKKRAEWEASVRAARGGSVTVRVQGWQQQNGIVWPVNSLVKLRSPLLGIDSDMLISEASYSLDDSSGTTTTLTLKRPEAYLPEPAGDDPWKDTK